MYGAEPGFVAFNDIDVMAAGRWRPNVNIDRDGAWHGPEELKLTGAEAANRLWTNLRADRIYFPSGATRNIDDLLIDRKTGAVKHGSSR